MAPDQSVPSGEYYSPPADPTGGGFEYTTTDINVHYTAIMDEDAAAYTRTADMWRSAATRLDTLHTNLTNATNRLREGWPSGEAQRVFMEKVDRARQSVREWRDVAANNASTFDTLASALTAAQPRMRALYDEYEAKSLAAQKDDSEGGLFGFEPIEDLTDMVGENRLGDLTKEYTERSRREIMSGIANAFSEGSAALQRGTVYGGPKQAATPSFTPGGSGAGAGPGALPGLSAGAPGVHMAQLAAMAVRVPAVPPVPALPPRPPAVPRVPSLHAGFPLRGANAPQVPGLPPGLSGIGRPVGPPGVGGLGAGGRPGVPGVPAAPTGLGGGGGGGRPAVPPGLSRGLSGRNAPGGPGMGAPPGAAPRGSRPTRPQLSGRGGSGAPPGAPPMTGRRGAGGPKVLGKNPPGGPARQGIPGPGLPGSGAPPPLRGTRGLPKKPLTGRPGLPGELRVPGGPGLGGRRQSARPGLPETVETTRRALRPGLDGRGLATPGRATPAAGKPATGPAPRQTPPVARPSMPKEEARSVERVGDEKLFVVEETAPAVIERPAEKQQVKRPGPALGAGR